MTPIQIFFLIAAAATLLSAVMVVSARQIMHAALWLVLTLSGVAVLFVTLETGFFAVIQVVVYVGAIAILIIFAVMLTRVEQRDGGRKINSAALLSGLAALGVTGSLIFALRGWQAFSITRGTLVEQEIDNLAALGQAFVSPDAYAVPFEVASVLLIGALIGALYVANEQKNPREGA